jgi:methyl-accepting chemotaxis protein
MSRSNGPFSAPLSPPAEPQLQIRAKQRRDGNLLVNLSTGTRLTLSFIVAALIAALVVGAIGFQRSQSLTNQSQFYQNLLRINTNLTTGAQYLQLMRAETQSILTQLTSTQTSQETLNTEEQALINLSNRYDGTLTRYIENEQLSKHPDETALLLEANHGPQINQQATLSSSALRTWRVYQSSVTQVLAFIKNGQTAEALHLEQFQVEPTNADALSAVRALIQFDSKLATSVQDAASVEQQAQYISTIISSIIAFIAIVLIGWIISGTIVRRLNRLREVTKDVEQGQLNRRVKVIGRDEIAEVSASVNAMLEAIVGLLEETRHQRDALTNAAEHLFTDMRVVSAGDLRVNASVSNDPIGMLANAFNFTVGRFRRFVQRTRTIAEQLDVIAHQEIERAEKFTQSALSIKTGPLNGSGTLSPRTNSRTLINDASSQRQPSGDNLQSLWSIQNEQDLHSDQILFHLQELRASLRPQNEGSKNGVAGIVEHFTTITERLMRLVGSITPASIRQEEMQKRAFDEIYLLRNQMKTVASEFQNNQKNILKHFQELDREIAETSLKAQARRAAEIPDTALARVEPAGREAREAQEAPTEIMQLSAALASDIIGMARQLNSLAQEIRTGIISFQLDTVEGNTSLSNIPVTPARGYDLTSDIQHPRSIPASRGRG